MVRSALGILGGGVVWMAAFFTLRGCCFSSGLRMRLAPKCTWTRAPMTSPLRCPLSMSLFWLLAECRRLGRGCYLERREAAWVLAALLMLYMSFMHLYYAWDNFPWWYNLAVALPSGLAVLLGGKLAGRWVRRSPVSVPARSRG